ncbi:unnamed protein product [Musa banksii]
MGGARRSMAEEAVVWSAEDEHWTEWRCRKHTSSSQPRDGICPGCLRDRLLRLCPDCANERPCSCFRPSSSSSSSCSSVSSISLADLAGSAGGGAGIGAVGLVSRLIDSEPAFRRSRSVGFQLLRTRSVARHVDGGEAPRRPNRGRRWALFWPFPRAAGGKESAAELSRSRSVGAAGLAGPSGGEDRGKAWGWHFPSPMNAFRHRRSTKLVHERSPLYSFRGFVGYQPVMKNATLNVSNVLSI